MQVDNFNCGKQDAVFVLFEFITVCVKYTLFQNHQRKNTLQFLLLLPRSLYIALHLPIVSHHVTQNYVIVCQSVSKYLSEFLCRKQAYIYCRLQDTFNYMHFNLNHTDILCPFA